MAPTDRRFPSISVRLLFSARKLRKFVTGVAVLLLTIFFSIAFFAQDQPQKDQSQQEEPKQNEVQQPSEPQAPAPQEPARPATVVIPAGTRFPMALTSSVSSGMLHRGDNIHAQVTNPITAGDQVAIPAGTYVQGILDKMKRSGTRAEITLQSASVIFPDGFVGHIAGPIQIESDEGTAWNNPGGGTKAGVMLAPALGLGIGAAIGAAAHTSDTHTFAGQTITSSSPRGLAIGSIVGLAAGAAVSVVLLARNHGFYMEVGSPLQMTVPEPITLAQDQVADANRAAQVSPPPAPPAPPVVPVSYPAAPANHGTCFTPGTPGTPPTVIPGVPGPNGIPGPPTVIPGTPPTPGTPYPCP